MQNMYYTFTTFTNIITSRLKNIHKIRKSIELGSRPCTGRLLNLGRPCPRTLRMPLSTDIQLYTSRKDSIVDLFFFANLYTHLARLFPSVYYLRCQQLLS